MTNQEDINIVEHIELHIVTDGQGGWAHTHGMDKFGCADLEVRGIPLFLAEQVADLLNHVAQYIVYMKHESGKPVLLGDVVSMGPHSTFRLVKLDPIHGSEEHFIHERWALSDEPMRGRCSVCESGCNCGELLN